MNEYRIDKITHPGLYSKINYDKVFTAKNKDSLLFVVADGVGKSEGALYAASSLINKLSDWFLSLDDINIEDIKKQLELLLNKINRTLSLIRDCEVVFALAIVADDKTLIANVGDSRIYIYKNNKFTQVSIDDSIIDNIDKEYMRYYYLNNVITRSIGGSSICNIHMSYINNDYDKLLLVTDGITKCLSDKRIEYLYKKYDKDFMDKLLYEVLYVKDDNFKDEAIDAFSNSNYLYKDVIPGIDNISAISYLKKKKK